MGQQGMAPPLTLLLHNTLFWHAPSEPQFDKHCEWAWPVRSNLFMVIQVARCEPPGDHLQGPYLVARPGQA